MSKATRISQEKFTWKPDVPTATYYVFVPTKTLMKIHENRKDENEKMLDYGGNNLGSQYNYPGSPDEGCNT